MQWGWTSQTGELVQWVSMACHSERHSYFRAGFDACRRSKLGVQNFRSKLELILISNFHYTCQRNPDFKGDCQAECPLAFIPRNFQASGEWPLVHPGSSLVRTLVTDQWVSRLNQVLVGETFAERLRTDRMLRRSPDCHSAAQQRIRCWHFFRW